MFKVGDSVEVVKTDGDSEEYLGMVGIIVGIYEETEFPYEVEFYEDELFQFSEEEIAYTL